MHLLTYWQTVTIDRSNFLQRLISLLTEHQIHYCVIGGQAVNAYVEPLVSLNLDLVVAVEQLKQVEELLAKEFLVQRFPHSLNVYAEGSALRVQIQTDPRYADFPKRAQTQEVLRIALPVAAPEDTLQGKIWAATDPERRASKRQKDLADIARLVETYPELRAHVPETLLARLW
ncbi:MAG: nucleotidyl transferase AbiEii/AbiGii toxin family protein [Caldilinea sp.]|nr:nucleotidyl transferase AbiEii/AbiGii toxin family protein [Caldilinea sp.]MDW8440266.1 nucleotidyl transferase AbiEii/AbiGii toxin family protein [Caldilineaceae bacterium]